jgi:hypothetical protein
MAAAGVVVPDHAWGVPPASTHAKIIKAVEDGSYVLTFKADTQSACENLYAARTPTSALQNPNIPGTTIIASQSAMYSGSTAIYPQTKTFLVVSLPERPPAAQIDGKFVITLTAKIRIMTTTKLRKNGTFIEKLGDTDAAINAAMAPP